MFGPPPYPAGAPPRTRATASSAYLACAPPRTRATASSARCPRKDRQAPPRARAPSAPRTPRPVRALRTAVAAAAARSREQPQGRSPCAGSLRSLSARPPSARRAAAGKEPEPHEALKVDEDEEEDEDGGDGDDLEDEEEADGAGTGARPAALRGPDDWQGLLKWAAGRLGLRLGAYWSLKGVVRERLQERVAALGCADLQAYQRLLEAGEDELQVLQTSVLQIDISRFFRTGTLWQFLMASVLPQLQDSTSTSTKTSTKTSTTTSTSTSTSTRTSTSTSTSTRRPARPAAGPAAAGSWARAWARRSARPVQIVKLN